MHDKGRPAFAIVIGRLHGGERFLSRMLDGLDVLIDKPVIGRRISVATTDNGNLSRFA